jgi:hypothetical protein
VIFNYDDIPTEVWHEMQAGDERLRRIQHSCDECRGRTGKGSPCYEEPEDESRGEEEA